MPRSPPEPHPVDLARVDRAVVLGRDWRVGLADAGALALRETAQMWAESYPAMEYRHGPIATAGPGAVVWLLDDPPTKLVDEIAATGATVVVAKLDPLAELIRIQRLAVALAEQRGLDPDRPANLERAVVLDLVESGGLVVRRAERLDGILARLASDGSVSVRELAETSAPHRRPSAAIWSCSRSRSCSRARTAARSATGCSTSCRSATGAAGTRRRRAGSPMPPPSGSPTPRRSG